MLEFLDPFGQLSPSSWHLSINKSKLTESSKFSNQVLEGLEMTKEQFIDLCILLGCDYCDKIKGIGPKNALKLIQVRHNETIIGLFWKQGNKGSSINNVKQIRTIFRNTKISRRSSRTWTNPSTMFRKISTTKRPDGCSGNRKLPRRKSLTSNGRNRTRKDW